MPTSRFNLIGGPLSRTPLRLIEALTGEKKRSWDVGYHHAVRRRKYNDTHVKDKKAYKIGYHGRSADKTKKPDRPPSKETHHGERGQPSPLKGHSDIPPAPAPAVGPTVDKTTEMAVLDAKHEGLTPGFGHKFLSDPQHYETCRRAFSEAGQNVINRDQILSRTWKLAEQSLKTAGPDSSYEELREAHTNVQDACSFLRSNVRDTGIRHLEKYYSPEIIDDKRQAFSEAFSAKIVDNISKTEAERDAHRTSVNVWASYIFDKWGPVAEKALETLETITRVPHGERGHYAESWLSQLTYSDDASLAHEFGHHIEKHITEGSHARKFSTRESSYWARRVAERATSNPEPLKELTGIQDYGENEVAVKDKWANPYMGKVYNFLDEPNSYRGGTEIVSMLNEASTGHVGMDVWSKQFKADSSLLAEYAGFVDLVVKGAVLDAVSTEMAGRLSENLHRSHLRILQ